MPHPADNNKDVKLSVTETTQLTATVIQSIFNSVDGSYHYDLQCQMSDGNNAATVQVNDVHQSLVILKD